MKNTLLKISAGILCASLLTPAYAQPDFYSVAGTPPPPSTVNHGYSVSPGAPPSTTAVVVGVPRHSTTTVVYTAAHGVAAPGVRRTRAYRHQQPFWIAMHNGEPIPTNAVVGGNQYHPNSIFYVCRANYRGGVHPGKFFKGNCNISWGGREIVMPNYEILISDTPLAWEESSHGAIPRRAIEGGRENHEKLFICQAEYENGTHPGKVVGNSCNFGWGGREVMTPYYNVLVS